MAKNEGKMFVSNQIQFQFTGEKITNQQKCQFLPVTDLFAHLRYYCCTSATLWQGSFEMKAEGGPDSL